MKKTNKITVIIIILVVILIMIVGTCVYVHKEKINNKNEQEIEEEINLESEKEFIGEEDVDDDQKSNEEIAMEIAKNEWGDNDQSVTFSIEQNDGAIYHIAVKKDATVITWYEINVEERTINEYF